MIASLVESMIWTVVVTLPVVMELDDLSSSPTTQLADATAAAVDYIVSHIRSHSASLKLQTSKGNYVSSLNVVRRTSISIRTARVARGRWTISS
jgi:protein SMG6